jgi:ABC-type phosphate/phosphonate transport system substrate-binding protein
MNAVFVAALPMYDFAWTAAAQDALWASLAGRLRRAGLAAPENLTRDRAPQDVWRDPALIFAQTCGYPYVTALEPRVTLIATPCYGFEGCEGARHRSFIIARRGDARRELLEFRGARAALNGPDSNSGMNLFRAALAPLAGGKTFFASVDVTGSHAASLSAVAEGRADIAAIDCVSFALLQRGRAELTEAVGIVARTALAPGLPFIASAGLPPDSVEAVRAALTAALGDPALAAARATLGLTGALVLRASDYAPIAEFERAAARLGYPTLA